LEDSKKFPDKDVFLFVEKISKKILNRKLQINQNNERKHQKLQNNNKNLKRKKPGWELAFGKRDLADINSHKKVHLV